MRISLKLKAVAVVLIFTIVLSVSIVLISYNTYTRAFTDHYESLATSVAKSTATVVDRENVKAISAEVLKVYHKICDESGSVPDYENFSDSDWESYYAEFEYITGMTEYKELLNVLGQLREDNDVVSLYLGYTDLETMKDLYLVDASAEEQCLPGDCDDIQEDHIEQIKAGNYEFPAFITNYEEYGWLCSASAPIIDEDGNVIGVALVDISMNDIMRDRQDFLYTLTAITSIMALVMILLIVFLMNKAMLNPINKLSLATGSFVSGKKENDGDSEISKLSIKTGDEIENLAESIKKMEKDLNTYITELTVVTSEKERIGAELDVATHIQSSMLPCLFPAFPERQEFDVHASMTPAKEVGGDFYDFFMVDDRHLAIVMADVSGKGVPAALFMVIAKTLIKDHTTPERDLGEVFTKVNNLLCESNSEGLFVTAFEGVLDLVTGEFNFVNAGHEPPYICKKGENFEVHKIKAGFVLAGMEEMRYKSGSIMLEEGDKIFQYTDGVTEATNLSNELFGSGRLNKVLNDNSEKTPGEILEAVKRNIDEFVGEANQFDDITMLCLEYKKRMTAKGQTTKELSVKAKVENIAAVTEFVEAVIEEHDCDMKAKTQINIAIDEIFGNIAQYAYAPGIGDVTVRVDVTDNPKAVKIVFIDSGTPYNPLEKSDPDTTLSAEEREIGGLGIYMVKKSMDEMNYEYKNGQNILCIKKNI